MFSVRADRYKGATAPIKIYDNALTLARTTILLKDIDSIYLNPNMDKGTGYKYISIVFRKPGKKDNKFIIIGKDLIYDFEKFKIALMGRVPIDELNDLTIKEYYKKDQKAKDKN